MSRRPIATVLALLAGSVIVAAGQQPVFRSGVAMVRVDVLATDRGKPIRDLESADFDLRDNGVPQKVAAVFAETEALDVYLVLDASGSVKGPPLEHLQEAALALLDALRAPDRAQLTLFHHRVLVPARLDTDRQAVRSAIQRIEATGYTSLLDALYLTMTTIEATANRSMALVFSDGLDNRSWLSSGRILDVARQTETVTYAVAFRPPHVYRPSGVIDRLADPDEDLLRSLAEQSGGKLIWAEESKELKAAFLSLLAEMRARYLLTYYPTGVAKPGWHTLDVRLRNRSGKVVARSGYMQRPAAVR